MIERLIEYREAQQFRKDRKRRQDQKRALTILVPCMVLLLIGAGISAIMGEEEPAPAVKAVATPSQASEPVEALSTTDDQEYTSKQEQFCLEVAQMKGFKEPGVTKRIEACLLETAGWPMEDFE
jgi:flagellar basal body-associated protein FliL